MNTLDHWGQFLVKQLIVVCIYTRIFLQIELSYQIKEIFNSFAKLQHTRALLQKLWPKSMNE